VMANHASFIDPLILAAIMKDTFTSIVAVEYLHIPLWGWLVKRFRGIPIERKNREAALRSIALAEERLKRGMHVAIMPEGTRTLTGKVGPLKKGGFHMAINCGAPIQVVGIEGAFHIKAKNSNILRSGEVVVRFGKIIPPERYEQATMEAIIKEVRQEFIILSGEASA
ncbi:MAG: 1-acyl-sn-glycerol-3-phosphate acyltransferase, partial [Candidatus Marinimicrobia bacterium]|nr:1-acyl-sn-glycerol-3-phosphate acyltransferase [Candidatus Neomarinimicrobiota bacterium]